MQIALVCSHAIHSVRLIDAGMYRSAWFVSHGYCLQIMRHDSSWCSLIYKYAVFVVSVPENLAWLLGGGTWTGLIWIRIGTGGGRM